MVELSWDTDCCLGVPAGVSCVILCHNFSTYILIVPFRSKHMRDFSGDRQDLFLLKPVHVTVYMYPRAVVS